MDQAMDTPRERETASRVAPRLSTPQFLRCHAPQLLILLVLCGSLFFPCLGDRSLTSSHEARAAQDSQSILDNDDWLLPQLFDRQVELQKPPLYYWMVAVWGWLQGGRVDAWSVRLPAALSATATVLLIFAFGLLRRRPLAGFLAAAMLASCLHFTWLARVGRIDMPLTFTTTLCLAGLYLGHCRRSEGGGTGLRWLLLAYLALGAGLLLKGPIALVLPGVVVLLWAAQEYMVRTQERNAHGWHSLGPQRPGRNCNIPSGTSPSHGMPSVGFGAPTNHYLPRTAHHSPFSTYLGLWWGLPLAVGLALPWYVAANVQTRGELFRVFFWYHNFARGFGGEELLHAYPWWFYGPRLLLDMLPWSLLLPLAAWLFFRRREYRHDPMVRFGLVWLLAVTLLLSCMHFKRADYLLPAYPGAALFLGCIMERWWLAFTNSPALRVRRWLPVGWSVVLLACVLGWAWHIVAFAKQTVEPESRLAAEIRRRTDQPVLLFRTEAHDLAFHIGPPLVTLLEWENLDVWAARPTPYYVIMPLDEARCWPTHLRAGQLVEVLRATELTSAHGSRPLVVLRTQPWH
jgi:4-amino-4-deoxy-L-arabinose transferase-like glycosyltransferase